MSTRSEYAQSPHVQSPPAGLRRPNHVYIRRRIMVASVFFSLVAALGVGAGNVLANRGGVPASASVVRQANTYLVQPGDTMWSIAEVHRDGANLMHFIDDMIALNGGTTLQIGQQITLP
ncbi:hypothetical protein BH10ACT2_BH10ACT2_04820 [soil metagenome]